MSLKTDYLAGSTSITTKMDEAFVAGVTFIQTNRASLSSALAANAAAGKKVFEHRILVTLNVEYLRDTGLYRQCFFAGIKQELAEEDIFDFEVSLSLDTSQATSTKVIFNFTF
jgi:hypothetical protein